MVLDAPLAFEREQDFIEYQLFPNSNSITGKDENQYLIECLEKCRNLIEIYTKNYLWHRDKIILTIKNPTLTNSLEVDSKTESFPSHLYGISHFGDNLEDEWFIMYILFQISRELPLIIKATDADGEFLLIEAANHLPSWADPKHCEDRVYISAGNVHIIKPKNGEEKITIAQALLEISQNAKNHLVTVNVQKAILNKISNFPDNIAKQQHKISLYLPVQIAAILQHNPCFISTAVHSYCDRDIIDMKNYKQLKYFDSQEYVYTSVRFSKFLYAMLNNSKLIPSGKLGLNLPPVNDAKYKSHYYGLKVTLGFEILLSQAKPEENLQTSKGWKFYMKSLEKNNYFNNLLEHSKEYNNLLNAAKEYYKTHCDSMHYSSALSREILHLCENLKYDVNDFGKNFENLVPDDDESWLHVTPDEIDTMLRERYTNANSNINPVTAPEFTKKVSTFLGHISDLSGAELPRELNPESSKVDFDADQFAQSVEDMLNLYADEDLDLSDSESENMDENEKSEILSYMKQMDKELASSTIGESFEKGNDSDIEGVDVESNAFRNMLESCKEQLGEAGPTTSVLGSMGLYLDVSSNNQFKTVQK